MAISCLLPGTAHFNPVERSSSSLALPLYLGDGKKDTERNRLRTVKSLLWFFAGLVVHLSLGEEHVRGFLLALSNSLFESLSETLRKH
jgi:hypothetical protein